MCIVCSRAKLVASNRIPDVPVEGDSIVLPASTSSSSWAHSIPLPEKGAVLMAHPLQFTDSQVGTGVGGHALRICIQASHRVLLRDCVIKDSATRCFGDMNYSSEWCVFFETLDATTTQIGRGGRRVDLVMLEPGFTRPMRLYLVSRAKSSNAILGWPLDCHVC